MSAHAEPVVSPSSGAHLKRSVRRGAKVALWAQVFSQLISLIVLATLYRLLKLDDYGLFGVVIPVLMLVRNLATLGMGAAAVQHGEMTPEVSNVLFWWNVWIGLATSVLTLAAAPLVGWAYGSAEAGWLTMSLAGASLLAALGTQHQALLERRLAWNALAVSRLWGQAIAGFVAVQLALRGHGVWSLVAQQYLDVAVTTALVWWYEPWRPTLPSQHDDARRLLGFGGHFSGAGLMFFIAANSDKILLGALAKTTGQTAAYYTQAFNFMLRPVTLVTGPLNSLILTSLSRARDDAASYREVYLGFQRLIAVVMFPVSVGLCVTAPDVMRLLGGDDWRGAGDVLRMLAPTILVQGFINTASSAFASVGRADRLFSASTLIALASTATYLVMILGNDRNPQLALILAATSSAVSIACFVPYQAYCLRTIRISSRAWLTAVWRGLLSALLMGAVVTALRGYLHSAQWWRRFGVLESEPAYLFVALLAQVLLGVACYVVFAWPECRWLWEQLRHKNQEPGASPTR